MAYLYLYFVRLAVIEPKCPEEEKRGGVGRKLACSNEPLGITNFFTSS
jgi:hypothetical protein